MNLNSLTWSGRKHSEERNKCWPRALPFCHTVSKAVFISVVKTWECLGKEFNINGVLTKGSLTLYQTTNS